MDEMRQEIDDALRAMDALVDEIRAEGVTWPLYWAVIDAKLRLFQARQRYEIAISTAAAAAADNERYVVVSRAS